MDLGYDFQYHIFCQRCHFRPVFDVRTKLDLLIRICHALAVEYTVCVNRAVEVIFWIAEIYVHIGSRSQVSFVCCSSCDGTCIHQCYGRNLAILQFASFTVREVTCRVTDTQGIVCRCITCSETWSAECCLHDRTCCHQICQSAVSCQFYIDRSTCRVYA